MPVSNRRRSREAALQSLYQMEMADCSMTEAVQSLRDRAELPPDELAFAAKLVEGVFDEVATIDAAIGPKLVDWTIERLAPIDRSILRIAAYELYFRPEIPPAVTLNEAVVMAKKFSAAESGRFVNGVLGAVLLESPKADWDRASAPPESIWEEPAPPDVQEVEELTIDESSPEAKELAKAGLWKLRSEPRP